MEIKMAKKINKSHSELVSESLETTTEIEAPYELPDGWKWVKISEVATCMDNFRKPINSDERNNRFGNIPYYGATGQVGWIDDFLTNEQLVLVGEDGAPFLDLIKDKAYIIEGKAWVNNHAHILKSSFGESGNKYLLHYLNNFNYTGYVNGTTRLKLTQGTLVNMPFPLPPTLEEQKRIVTRIETLFAKLDQAKEKAQTVVDSFETRKAAILHQAFTGQLTKKWRAENGVAEDSWEVVHLEDVAKKEKNALKAGPFGSALKKDFYVPKGYKIYGQEQVLNSDENYGDYYIDETKYKELESCKVSPNDILVSLVGTVGKTLILTENCLPGIINPRLIKISLDKELMLPRFFVYYFGSDYCKSKYMTVQHGTTMDVLNMGILKSLEYPCCSLPEQTEIVRILDSILEKENKSKEVAQTVLEQIDLLKKSILARAFRGEI